MKMTVRRISLMMAIILFVNLILINNSQSVQAAVDDGYVVRIGLTSTYSGKSSITINNTSVKLGYDNNGNFQENFTINSSDGITFKPDNTYCYGSVNIYSSYSAAVSAVNSMNLGNYAENVVIAVQGNNAYRVYVSASDVFSASTIATSLESNGMKFEAVSNDSSYRMKMTWSAGSLIVDVDSDGLYPQFMAAASNDAGVYVVDLGERSYRGKIEIGRFRGSSNLTAVSVIGMEEYLYGVIACEMVSSWEMEALKAQAVCARSYAYAIDKRNMEFGAANGYALYDTTKSQVYKGYGYETERTNSAVDATRGLMIYYRENVVKSYFYSTSGGHTANCEDVWSVALTYFRGVADNTELHQEKKPWIVKKNSSELVSDLADEGINVGTVNSLIAQIRTTSGRIYQLKVNGTSGSHLLKKEEISSTFSLPSTKVKIIKAGDVPDRVYVQSNDETKTMRISESYVISGDGEVNAINSELEQYIVISEDNLTNFPKEAPTDSGTFYFAGMGYGHGVGMSQSGAQSLAKQGYDYEYIIHHYYNKVEIR